MTSNDIYPPDLDIENSDFEDLYPADLNQDDIYLDQSSTSTAITSAQQVNQGSLRDRAFRALNSDLSGDVVELAASMTKVGGPIFSYSKTLGDSTLTGTSQLRKEATSKALQSAASISDGYRAVSSSDYLDSKNLSVNIYDTIYSEVKNEIFKYEKYGESDIIINGVRERSVCGVNSKYFPKEYARLKDILSRQKDGVMKNEDIEEINKVVSSVIISLMDPVLKSNSIIIAANKEAQKDIVEYIGVMVKAIFLAPSVAKSYFKLSNQNFVQSCNQPRKNANGLYNYMMNYFISLDKKRNTDFSKAYQRRFKEKTIIE